jgi:hypothetical protein
LIFEYTGNLHVHTPYSDGHGTHDQVALDAIRAGLDFVVVTDHNVWVDGMDGYRYHDKKRVLLLTGEEVHDQGREPERNHLLAYEAFQELSLLAPKPQRLVETVRKAGGHTFLAHPADPAAPTINQPDLSWVDWEVERYTGLEIWNFMSEFKSHITSIPKAFFYAYLPTQSANGPFPEVLDRWDQLLASGKKVVAIGGADAHALPIHKGPFKRIIFPYEFLFRAVNTHVLMKEPLRGELENDRKRLFHSIALGRCFVGYDLPASTHGFRFTAQGDGETAIMGESIKPRYGVTLQIKLPRRAEIRLIKDGALVRRWEAHETAVLTVTEPGAYRAEAHIDFRGKRRGWIFSNPIYLTP